MAKLYAVQRVTPEIVMDVYAEDFDTEISEEAAAICAIEHARALFLETDWEVIEIWRAEESTRVRLKLTWEG